MNLSYYKLLFGEKKIFFVRNIHKIRISNTESEFNDWNKSYHTFNAKI